MDSPEDKIVKLTEELISRPSVTPHDKGCQAIIADRLSRIGFHCESLEFGEVTNLWARLGHSGPLLCFAGHTDVVPPGDTAAWTSPPFSPDIRGGKLYGRGAADMKSSLAAMIVAMERYLATTKRVQGSIAFLITSDEEGAAVNGTRRVIETLSERGEKIDWCIVGEPSSYRRIGDQVRIGRRGSLSGHLTIHGVQGHVAYPEQTDNPIRRFAPVLAQLHDKRWDDGNDDFPPTSFEVVRLESGIGALNVTPPSLSADFNFRFSTDWNYESLQRSVTDILDASGIRYEIAWQPQGRPFLTKGGTLVNAVTSAIAENTGSEPTLSTSGGTSDGRFIAPTGAEVVEIGPVNESIHKVDEHVRIADLAKLAAIYERVTEILFGAS